MNDRRTAKAKRNGRIAQTAWLLAFLTLGKLSLAQTLTAPADAAPRALAGSTPAISEGTAPIPRGVSYTGGQLAIDAANVTLSEVLNKVAAITGIKIDLPPEANAERIPLIKLGPGPARQILAALLRDTHFNFLIAATESDPEKLQSVLIMPADTKESAPPQRDAGQPALSYKASPAEAAPAVSLERRPASDSTSQIAENGSQNPTPPADPNSAGNSPPLQDTPVASLASASSPSETARAGALSPPPVLNQQSISQQLQQMYQQRAQMTQQGRQSGTGGN